MSKRAVNILKGVTSRSDLKLTCEERYEELVESFLQWPEVSQEGKGFGSQALKVKGKIFAMLNRDHLIVKLPKARAAELVATGEGEQFDPRRNGHLMKEWLVLSPTSDLDWHSLANEAKEFVASQK